MQSVKPLPRWGYGIVGRTNPQSRLDVCLDGSAISRLELYGVEVVFENDVIGVPHRRMVGVGGVWTASRFRKKGLARRLLDDAHAFSNAFHYDGLILFTLAELVSYYTKCGFEKMLADVTMLQPRDGVAVRVPVPECVSVMVRADLMVDVNEPAHIRSLPW